jgi:O-antigen/teichoic acid export membrane protein
MPLQSIKKQLKSDYFKSLSVLLSGTLIAQVIGYAIAPLLTRLYSTAEMGELALYMRITGFIAAIATLRYESALPIPKNDGHSYLLYRISLLISFIVLGISSILLISLILAGITPGFSWWYVLLIIFGSAAIVVINIGTNWSVRTGTFSLISRQKIVNSLFSNTLKWGFAYFSMGYFGLIVATFIGYFLSSFEFIFSYRGLKRKYSQLKSRKKTWVLLKDHREFPLLNLPHILVDHGRDILIATLILAYFSESIYGSFSHSYAMLRIPSMLIGVSLSQVFYNQAIKLYNENKRMLPLLKKTIGMLIGISIIPFTILYLFGEPIFAWIFGVNWAEAGSYSETMSFWLMVSFIISPISALPMILKKQKIAFVFGIISALIQIIPLFIIPEIYGKTNEIFILCLQVISYTQAFWFLLVLGIYFIFVSRHDHQLVKSPSIDK